MSVSAGDILRGVRRARYQSLLKTVEWREFTQRMKASKGGRCEVCRSKHSLQTHHNYYDSERLPWEYACNEVRILCASCHEAEEQALRYFRANVAPLLTPSQLDALNGALFIALQHCDRPTIITAIVETVAKQQAK